MALFAGGALGVSLAAEAQPKPSQHRGRDCKTKRLGRLALRMQSSDGRTSNRRLRSRCVSVGPCAGLSGLGSYFGHLYPTARHVLVATGDRVFCVGAESQVWWRGDVVGIGSTRNKGCRAEETGEIMANPQPQKKQSLPGKT